MTWRTLPSPSSRGVLLQQLADDALQHGCMYPPDPGEKMATLGGNVSTNAGGMRAVKYGCTRDYVRAMTVVLPTGEITHFGSTVSKTSSGYSLTNLMIGSEGTLGIITELTLKLIPAPKATISLMAPFEDLDACISTVPKVFMNHFKPQALEFFEREILISSEEYLGKQVFPRQIEGTDVGAYLLMTFDGDSDDELDPLVERAAEMLLEEGAMDVLVADTAPKLKDTWAAPFLLPGRHRGADQAARRVRRRCSRSTRSPIMSALSMRPATSSTSPSSTSAMRATATCTFTPARTTWQRDEFRKQVDAFMSAIYKKAVELGGQISGEHGIGMGKVKYLAEAVGPVNMQLMQGIKKVFDPKMILNPGKVCCTL